MYALKYLPGPYEKAQISIDCVSPHRFQDLKVDCI